VAEVDLRTLRVTYHALDPVRTMQASTKAVEGPYRVAAWLGDGELAVTGWNRRGTRSDPAGVHLIDTRTWQRRTLAPRAQTFAATNGTLAVPLTAELAVFGADGGERFRVPGVHVGPGGRRTGVRVARKRRHARRRPRHRSDRDEGDCARSDAARAMRPLVVGLAVAVLAVPCLGTAKAWGNPQLCGPARCSERGAWLGSLPAGESPTVPAPARYYVVATCRHCSLRWYIPSARAMAPRAGSTFTRVTDEAATAFDRLAARVRPFPAPQITAAFFGGGRVRGDAGTYARLFELESPGRQPNRGADWVQIELRSTRDTPWTNGAGYLAYSASEHLLQRGLERFRVPDAIAARLERAEPITPA
jgi:hypothetical protein